MTSVVPTLKTHYTLGTFREPIDQLTFAFITPLSSNDNDVTTFGCFHLKPIQISVGFIANYPLPGNFNKLHGHS